MKVASTVDGEKVLYKTHPIETVEAARKPGMSTTGDMVAQPHTIVKAESTEITDVNLDAKALLDAGISVNDETASGSRSSSMWTETATMSTPKATISSLWT